MKKINEEETSAKKHRSFNVKRLATVMACALILVGATVGVAAKLSMSEKVSNVYTKWQDRNAILGNNKSGENSETEKVILNEEEKQIIEDLSIDVGYEFEVDGGKIRIDGIMYDSTYVYLMYTAIADDGKQETAADLLVGKKGAYEGLQFYIKGKERVCFGWGTSDMDLDENAEGHQGCFIADVHPIQYVTNEETGKREIVNNFSFSQGDVLVLTDRKYQDAILVNSLDELERIYGTLELTKPINDLIFTCENTEGMEVLETVTEIRLSPLSIIIMGDEALRKTNGKGISYHYFESGDKEALEAKGGYAVKVVKKDGSVAEFGDLPGQGGSSSTGRGHVFFCNQHLFERPLDLTEVDHILVWGWGLEYKIPVNVTE